MKRVGIAFLVWLFFTLVGIYITAYQSPFNLDNVLKLAQSKQLLTDSDFLTQLPVFINNGLIWDLLEPRRFFPWVFVWAASMASLVAALHLLVDKLFFRKFFEKPALLPAIRRGIWVALLLVAALFLRLINGLEWYNLASVFFLLLCIEILIINVQSGRQGKKAVKKP